jgi:hypothetical protein
LLIEYLKDPARAAPVERYLPAVLGTVFLATSVGLAAADFNEEISVRQRWATVGLVGALAGLSFSAYLAPDRARRPLLSSVSAMAVAGGGAAFYGSDEATSATRFTFGSMMLTGAIMEGLVLADAAMRPAPSARQLERHRERLESSTSFSDDDLRAAEAELALTERPIPLWLSPLVLMGGAVAAAAPALSPSTSRDDRQVCLVFSSGMLVAASSALVPALINEGHYRAYRRALNGLSLAPLGPQGSAGMTLAGSF